MTDFTERDKDQWEVDLVRNGVKLNRGIRKYRYFCLSVVFLISTYLSIQICNVVYSCFTKAFAKGFEELFHYILQETGISIFGAVFALLLFCFWVKEQIDLLNDCLDTLKSLSEMKPFPPCTEKEFLSFKK